MAFVLHSLVKYRTREIDVSTGEAVFEIGSTARYSRNGKTRFQRHTLVDIVASHDTTHHIQVFHE